METSTYIEWYTNLYGNLVLTSGNIKVSPPLVNNMNLTTNGTGYVSIPNVGLRLPNGSTSLNWYEEATLTGTWSNTTTPAVTSTIYIVRVGKQVTLQIVSPNITSSTIFAPSFSATLPSKFYPVSSIICPTSNNTNASVISISGLGIIALSTYNISASNNVEIHTSYYTNAVSSSGASGQIDPGSGSGSGSGGASGAGGASGSDSSGGSGSGSGSGDSGSGGSGSGGSGGSTDITGGSSDPGSGDPKP